MEEYKTKLSLNTSFDIEILKTILKKSWYWFILITGFIFTLSFFYLRYTKPIYKSSALIQINEEDQGAEILGFKNFTEGSVINKELEILRSQLLFNRAIANLPLGVTYYAAGDILTEHRYKQGSFHVDLIKLKDSSLYNIPIYIKNDNYLSLSFSKNGKEYEYAIDTNQTLHTPYFDVKLILNNYDGFLEDINKNQLYFMITDSNSIARRLKPGLNIELVDRPSQTIQVSYEGTNAMLSFDIVTVVIKEFLKYNEEVKKESSQKILSFIESQLDSLSIELTEAKDNIMFFQRNENITSPDKYSDILVNRMEELQQVKQELVEELRILKKINHKLSGTLESTEVYRLIPSLINRSYGQSLGLQINELYQLIDEKEQLLYKVTSENELVRKMNKRIAVRQQSIKEIIENLLVEIQEKLNITNEELKKQEQQFYHLPEKQMELSRLVNVKDLNEKYFTLMTEKKVIYSISMAGYISDNKVLNPPIKASSPIFPNLITTYSLAVFLSFLLSFIVIFIRYLLYNKIVQLSDFQNRTSKNVNILGQIPFQEGANNFSEIIVDSGNKTILSEHFRNIRTNLSFINNNAKTISVISTVSGEGKTFVALNISAIFALADKKVILIDLDMRKPSIHIGIGQINQRGMSNILANHCAVDEVIQNTKIDNLQFISAGTIPPNPSELLLGDKFKETIDYLKGKYDLIVIDNPPVGLVTDGVQLMHNIDIPIYVFRSDYSKRYYIDELNEVANKKGIKSVNVILNSVKISRKDFRKKYSSYYVDNK